MTSINTILDNVDNVNNGLQNLNINDTPIDTIQNNLDSSNTITKIKNKKNKIKLSFVEDSDIYI